MTNKELLNCFEQAKKDWQRPMWKRLLFGDRKTFDGLCYYFITQHRIFTSDKMDKLMNYWTKYRTKYIGGHHFNTREERIHAINMVIKDLKQQDNGK